MADGGKLDDDFASLFALTRSERDLSRSHVAEEMARRGYDMHVSTVGKIERGERRVTLGEAVALASIVGLRIQDFFTEDRERDLRLELNRDASNLLETLKRVQFTLANLSKYQSWVRRHVKAFDRLGEPFFNGMTAAEFFAPLIDRERLDLNVSIDTSAIRDLQEFYGLE